MTEEIKRFKEKLKNGVVSGLFSKTNDPAFVEAAGYAGFEFIILDLEHGPNSVESLQNLIRAAQISNILPIVRVKEENDSIVGEALDIGAAGIQVPKISTAESANKIIKLAKFSPEGERGVCRFVRAADYSAMNKFEYFASANESLIIIHLEGVEAINNLDELLKVKGIDIMFIGPYDLSRSLGVQGDIDNPRVHEKMEEIINKCSAHGVYVGTFVESIDSARNWKNAGVKYIAYSVDVGIFYDQCKFIIESIK